MLTGLLDVPYRKSFALLEELLERREAEEQTCNKIPFYNL